MKNSVGIIILACFTIFLFAGISYSGDQVMYNTNCHADDDEPGEDNVICQTDWYTPCCPKVDWTFDFYRTGGDAAYGNMKFTLHGTNVVRYYYKQNYSQGYHHDEGTANVSMQSQSKIVIQYIGASTGLFEDITATAQYSTPNGQ